MLSAFKNFFVTLLIALVIFGVAAYFASMFVTDTMTGILSSEKDQLDDIFEREDEGMAPVIDPTPETTPFADIQGESFSFLLVITDYRPDLYDDYLPAGEELAETDGLSLGGLLSIFADPYDDVGILSADYREPRASALVLVRGDKEKGRFTYTYLSPLTVVNTPTGYHTLGEVWDYYGVEVLTEHVRALTGIGADYTMVINGYHLASFVNYLGIVTVNLGKDIYYDGREYTTQYEYTRDAVDEDGVPYVEHIPNTFALGAGAVEVTADNAYILSALSERSAADISLKEAYTVEAVKQYLTRLSAMDDNALRSFTETLMQPRSAEGETGEDGEEAEADTAVIQTTFDAAAQERVAGVLRAVGLFESVTVTYPGTYTAAADGSDGRFEPDIQAGVELHLPFRATAQAAE